ncbi:MAG: glycosyltransferase family 4 protein [Butyrivibrio sp.]|nr:glycosyltransferase family 4 protein [Butyrivibrio sp.]
MRVLIINKFLYPNGGSETYIFSIGKQLEKMGHKVEYFGMEHKGRIVGNHAESYTDDMEFHGGGLGKLLYPFKILYSFEARKKLRVVLKDFKPDVVHLNNINFQLTPSIIDEIKHFNKNIKIIYTAHDGQWVCPNHLMRIPSTGERCTKCIDGKYGNCTKNKCIHNSKVKSLLGTIEADLYKLLGTYKKVDLIISPSSFLADKLSHNKALKGRIVALHNFVEYPEEYVANPKRDYVLYFGRYDVEKGMKVLIEACRRLPEVDFVFAGKGDYESEIEKLDNVKNVGFRNSTEIQKLIQNAKFTVFPSIWYENCPFSVIEAIINGTPVVGSNLGGTPELIKDKVTGLLYNADDVDELTTAIESLWRDDELCQKLSADCRKEAAGKTFDTLDDYCEKLVGYYEK